MIYVALVICAPLVIAQSAPVDTALQEAETYLLNEVDWSTNRPIVTENAAQSSYNPLRGRIYLRSQDITNSDVVQHEYGHTVMDKIYLIDPYCLQDTIFGSWSNHFYHKPMLCQTSAFNEGWSSAFSMAVRDNATRRFQPSGSGSIFTIPFENKSDFVDWFDTWLPEDPYVESIKTEGTVAMIMWDIVDDAGSSDNSPNIDDDSIYGRFDLLWETLIDGEPRNICEFYINWIGQSTDHTFYANSLYEIYRDNGIDKACLKSYIQELISDGIPPYDYSKMYDAAKAVRMLNRPTGPINSWPFSDHDLQRTAYTSLKGDIKDNESMDNWGWVMSGDYGKYDNPVIANVDDDPNQEILVTSDTGSKDGVAYVLDVVTKDGKTYGYQVQWKRTFPEQLSEPASVLDIDDDNTPEMVFAQDGFGVDRSCTYSYNAHTGGRDWRYCIGAESGYYGRLGNTAIVDIDQDGTQDVIFTDYKPNDPSWQGKLYVVDGKSGDDIANSPVNIGSAAAETSGGAWSAVSIADADKDGYPEIFVPTEFGIKVYEYNDENIVEKSWGNNDDAHVTGSVVISDLDKDNNYEAIYTTSNITNFYNGLPCYTGKTCENRLYVRNADTGVEIKNVALNFYPWEHPAVGDIISSSSNKEIVFSSTEEIGVEDVPGKIQCYNYDASMTTCQSWPFSDSAYDAWYINPIIMDINDNGDNDVLAVGEDGVIWVIKSDGQLLWTKSFGGEIVSTPAVGDWDNDGKAEIAVKNIAGSTQAMQYSKQKLLEKRFPGYDSGIDFEDNEIQMMLSTQTTGTLYMLDGTNKEPVLDHLEDTIAVEGDLLTISPTATDDNNDTITYYFSSPINASGLWKTNDSTEGLYEILVSATDGNLTDSQYVIVTVLRDDTTELNEFDDSSKAFAFNTSKDLTLANNSRIWIASMELSPNVQQSQTSYQENPKVIEANEYNISINYATDKNWSSYYTAGASTGAIIELQNNTITNNPGHVIFRLRLKIGLGGHGRFAVYNYDTGYYEVVTSTIPAFNESYRDIYFDVYNASFLWATNDTHYSMQTDDITAFINGDDVRWYYRYIDDDFADQRIYDSEVMFMDNPVYPEDVYIKLNDESLFEIEGELHEDFILVDHFNNSESEENFTFTNSTFTRYLRIPKNAEIISTVFGFGNEENISSINLTYYESSSFNFTSLAQCYDSSDPDFDRSPANNDVDRIRWGPYCADDRNWNIDDIDNDGYDEYYMYAGETYAAWARCDAESGHTVSKFTDTDYDVTYECDEYGQSCYDQPCQDDNEKCLYEHYYASPSASIAYPDLYCVVTGGDHSGWDGDVLKTDDDENYLVIECADNSDCDDDEACDTSAQPPTGFVCTNPICSPSCSAWENETYSNHECSCVLASGYCNESMTQLDGYHYCDKFHITTEIETIISINDTEVHGVVERDIIDIDLRMYIEDYLIKCTADELGYCDVPIIFASEWNTSARINKIEVAYKLDAIHFTSELQDEIDCSGDCIAEFDFNADGAVNLTNLTVYSSPNSKPHFVTTTNINTTNPVEVVVVARDPDDDYLNITANNSNFYQLNNTHLIWGAPSNLTGTFSVEFHVDDGLLSSEQVLDVTIIPGDVIIKNSTNDNIVRFTSDGDLHIRGSLSQSSQQSRTSSDEWVIRKNSEDIMIVNLVTGNMYIDGSLYENQTVTNTSDAVLEIDDGYGQVVSYLDADGDLYITGEAYTDTFP